MKHKNKILDTNNSNEYLSEIAPNLYKLGKSNDFIVPEGYFDELPNKITNKILSSSEKIKIQSKWVSLLNPKPIAIGVFTILLFILIFVFTNNIFDNSTNNIIVVNNTNIELDSLVKWFDLDEQQIAEIMYINNERAKLYSPKMTVNNGESINLNSSKEVFFDDIVNFLMDEDIDENDLLAINQ